MGSKQFYFNLYTQHVHEGIFMNVVAMKISSSIILPHQPYQNLFSLQV